MKRNQPIFFWIRVFIRIPFVITALVIMCIASPFIFVAELIALGSVKSAAKTVYQFFNF